jgi:hypothetical protein
MARVVFASVASSLCLAAAAAEVDLRATGALEALQHSNPAHYRKVEQILERTRQFPQAGPARWLPAGMQATDVQYTGSLMKPSYPPKQTLRFRLDDVRYTVDVTRHDVAARLIPAPR